MGSSAKAAPAAAAWRKVAVPNLGMDTNLTAVTAFSGKDAWAVGTKGSNWQSLVVRWNGKKWSEFANPSARFYRATDVKGSSGTDVWVIGVCAIPWGGEEMPCAARWNGKKWGTYILPKPAGGIRLESLTVNSRTDAWIAGNNEKANYYLHWNGEQWSPVGSPAAPAGRRYTIQATTAVGAKDVWAVGGEWDGAKWWPLVQHWNGKKWSNHDSARVVDTRLTTVVALPNRQLLAAGYGSNSIPRVQRYSGGSWQAAPTPSAPAVGITGMANDGNGGVWAAIWARANGHTNYARWDGKKWSPNQGQVNSQGDMFQAGVANVPKTKSSWAVGYYFDRGQNGFRALIEVTGPLPH